MINKEILLPCGVILKNRIAKSAMSENMADANHAPNNKFNKLYEKWSEGGAALIISGNVMIDQKALGEFNNVVVEQGHECLMELKSWAKFGTKNKTDLWMQINHPGKQSPKLLSSTPVAPSAIAYESNLKDMFNKPRALTTSEIDDLIKRFAFTAGIAKKAGFTGVQIHGAHGYLVSQFLSPLHNQREEN